jgi:hypothetical protein
MDIPELPTATHHMPSNRVGVIYLFMPSTLAGLSVSSHCGVIIISSMRRVSSRLKSCCCCSAVIRRLFHVGLLSIAGALLTHSQVIVDR